MNLGAAVICFVGATVWILNGFSGGEPLDFIVGGISILGGLYFTVKIFTDDLKTEDEDVT